MKSIAAAVILAATLIASSATAYADCGDPDQPPCTGPVPTVDQVVAILAELTDPDIPAANKTDIVTPRIQPRRSRNNRRSSEPDARRQLCLSTSS